VIRSAPYYWVTCDVCGTNAQIDSDYSAWVTGGDAEESAEEFDWCVEGGNHVCPDCIPPLPDEDDE